MAQEQLQPLEAGTDLNQALRFHSRERRRSLAGIPELFRTHRIFGGAAMAVANIATATFPVRNTEVTFKTAIRFADNTTTRTGLIFEFGSSTAGVAIWIEDQVIGFRAGGTGSGGVIGTFDNGAQWPAGLELEIVAAIRPGNGAVELWLNGKSVLKVRADAFVGNEWAASSAGSFAAAVQGTTPADVVQTGAPANFAVIEPMSVYVGQRPRQFNLPKLFSLLELNPVLWLDASDAGTISSSAGFVNGWDDKSASGADFDQLSGLAQPRTGVNTINSLNVIKFDGANDFIAATSVSVSFKQVFVVARLEAGSVTGAQLFGTKGSEAESIRMDALTDNFSATSSANDFARDTGEIRIDGAVAVAITRATAFLISAVHPGSAASFVSEVSGFTGGRWWKGDVAEVIGFDVELSASDRGDVQSYLADKWGITLV